MLKKIHLKKEKEPHSFRHNSESKTTSKSKDKNTWKHLYNLLAPKIKSFTLKTIKQNKFIHSRKLRNFHIL